MRCAPLLAFVVAFPAAAGTVPVPQPAVEWPGNDEITYQDGPFSAGFRFRVTGSEDLIVRALGAYDQGGNGLATPHAVGIWTVAGGSPLATATVSAGTESPLVGHFRYAPIAGLVLHVGAEYVVAAANYGIGFDPYGYDPSGFTSASGIEYLAPRELLTRFDDQLRFPTIESEFATHGWFGPNFLVEPVPAPGGGAWAIVTLGLARRSRRRR